MSEAAMSGRALTEEDVKERIDVGIAFLVLLLMGGLGAYLIAADEDGDVVPGLPDAGLDSAPSPIARGVEMLDATTDLDELREQRRLRSASTAPVLAAVSGAAVPSTPELQAEKLVEAVEASPALSVPSVAEVPKFEAVVAEKLAPIFEPVSEPVTVEAIPEVAAVVIPEPVAPVVEAAPAEVSDAEVAVLQQATSNVSFLTGSAILTEQSTQVLDEIMQLLRSRPDARLSVVGYTDSLGDADKNVALSFARAEACRNYLLERGATMGQVDSAGMGQRNPIGDNSTAQGRKENRRVEFTLLRGR